MVTNKKNLQQQNQNQKAQPSVTPSGGMLQADERNLLCVLGEKGGVGKSYFAHLLACYLLTGKLNTIIIDADRANRTLRQLLSSLAEAKTATITEDKEKYHDLDRVVEPFADIDKPQTVLLDTPANAEQALLYWLEHGGGAETLDYLRVDTTALYVVTASAESLAQFVSVRQQLKQIDRWVLVKNLYGRATTADFDRLMSDKTIVSAKKRNSFCEMFLHELRKPEIDLIRQQKLPITKAIEQTNLCGKTRLLRYQRQFEAELTAAFTEIVQKK